jgi:hypothetical protein
MTVTVTREYLDKIDDLIAEKVMGFTKFNKYGDLGWGIKGERWYSSYAPSRSLDHAWELVEKYFVQITPQINASEDFKFLASIPSQDETQGDIEVFAHTAPLAITLAVLEYEGIENPNED